jgi:hypothetical protein
MRVFGWRVRDRIVADKSSLSQTKANLHILLSNFGVGCGVGLYRNLVQLYAQDVPGYAIEDEWLTSTMQRCAPVCISSTLGFLNRRSEVRIFPGSPYNQ